VKHPNVLSAEGVVRDLFEFGIVSRWMDNGDLLSYVIRHPGVDRLDMLIGTTRGLEYLHENEIVHGDLKSSNVLIDAGGNPRLSDFGLSSIKRIADTVNASTPNHGSNARYCAPELLNTDGFTKNKHTTKSDIYSLSMVIVELATGKIPFHTLTDPSVLIILSKGRRPPKPRRFETPGITSEVWKVAKRCWHEKPRERPEAKNTLRDLERIASPASTRRGLLWF